MSEIYSVLEDWHFDRNFGVVWGYIYNDSKGRFEDGTYIHTSSVVPTGKLEEGFVLQTKNSYYKLGKKLIVN